MAGVVEGITSFLMTAFITLFIGGIIGVLAWMFYKSYWLYRQYKVTIFERDGTGGLHRTMDIAGIFVDKKTNNKRLFLKKMKVGLNADKIPYVHDGRNKMIYLLRTGLKNFRYLNLSAFVTDLGSESLKISVGEEDVNWALNELEKSKKAFAAKNKMAELLPYAAIFFTGMIVLVVSIYIIQQWPEIASQLTEFSKNLATVSQNSGGTRIL